MKTFSKLEDIGAVRLKIIESCNWSCNFCHNEGNISAEKIYWDNELQSALMQLKDILNISEVHLTGWEPTLNKNIEGIIDGISNLGMKTKMTTNGQFNETTRTNLVDSGIEAVNFSLQSVDPNILIAMMKKSKTVEWGEEQIQCAKDNIIHMQMDGVKTRINCVISSRADISRVSWVLEWGLQQGIETRILDDLTNKAEAAEWIQELIQLFEARLVRIIHTPWTSSVRSIYETRDKKEFMIKGIEPVYLRWLCEECPHFEKDTCQEGFYNIRLQKDYRTGKYIVVLCIQNQNEESILSLEKFLALYKSNHYAVPTLSGRIRASSRKSIIPIRSI